MPIAITNERPDSEHAAQMIEELEELLGRLYPRESRHGFSVEKLVREGVAFFVIWKDGLPAGCGGVHIIGKEYAELKRMYVRPAFRGLGLGKLMLEHLITHTREQGIATLRLETGVHQSEAIGLYEHMGFERIPPFAAYRNDPLSCFFEKTI